MYTASFDVAFLGIMALKLFLILFLVFSDVNMLSLCFSLSQNISCEKMSNKFLHFLSKTTKYLVLHRHDLTAKLGSYYL